MIISYNKLWKLLIDREMNRTDLIPYAGISSNVLSKMSKNEPISNESLEKICYALDCHIDDVVEINDTIARYSQESNKKSNGAVYTPTELADYLSSSMVHTINKNYVSILDPAIGDGELVLSIVERIKSLKECKIKITGFELDEEAIGQTYARLHEQHPDVEVNIIHEDFLEYARNNVGTVKFDFIIANPPYIRTQILGSTKAQTISKQMRLSGRVDIYYAFLLYADQFLEDDGVAGYITSNKFMTTKAGKCVREYLSINTHIDKITDFGDTKIFDASVLPCIIVFKRGKTQPECVDFTTIYQTESNNAPQTFNSIFEIISVPGEYSLKDSKTFKVCRGALNLGDSWTISTSESRSWLSKIDKKTHCRFSDIGKIKVGIKTTADNVFILNKQSDRIEEIELSRPLITHRNAGQILPNDYQRWSVLYPYDMNEKNRTCLDIEKYPKTREYLEKHRAQLESRKYVTDAGRQWYEIWVPQKPNEWKKRKIVFRDICETPQFWLDDDSIVNGDCYWIAINDDVPNDIIYLALAVANSRFIEKFYDTKFNNKLYSGKRRYMSRYVEQFPIPDPDSKHSIEAINLVKRMIKNGHFDQNIMDKINESVNAAFD